MKKVLFAITVLATTAYSQAENRLFPTDILKQGEAELSAGINTSYARRESLYNGTSIREKFDATSEFLQLRYGIGRHWHVGLALPYISSSQYNDRSQSRHESWQNPSAWAKYSFTDGTQSPYSLTAELDVIPNLTGKDTNAYAGTLTVSSHLGNGLKPYASYTMERVTNHDYRNSHHVSIGAFKELNSHLTFTPHLFYQYGETSQTNTSYDQYGINLSGLAQINKKTTLRAGVNFYKVGAFDSKIIDYQAGKLTGHSISASIYHLF